MKLTWGKKLKTSYINHKNPRCLRQRIKTKYYFQKTKKVPPGAFTEHLGLVRRITKPLRMARKQVHARGILIYALNYYMTVLHTIG